MGIVTSAENFAYTISYGLMGNFVYSGQGYLVGILVTNDDSAKIVNFMIIMIVFATNGILCNS